MEISHTRNSGNGVNGRSSLDDAAMPSRSGYVRFVFSDLYQATAGGSSGHAQKVSGSSYRVIVNTVTRIVRRRLPHGT